ncbi:septum formation protein [Paenibacillus shirakamiensis]|uniref:dTTP/UTP pyrophosphatase n=1 Tax=Paenibacillus shirakamiensis TaxID=1265935 RepID=A0ABS4JFC1_9BACL|nr:Maf family protein [Paenibacillus shirakamiensis]MBP2000404.1 septum formation protein [Paenibacillus shirakamiensis]
MENNDSFKIILASTSPRRRELIAGLHIPFEMVPSHADESTPGEWSPKQMVEELSLRKAEAVYHRLQSQPGQVIVGSDTIVVLDHKVFGKPQDKAESYRMLQSLQGRTHQVYTGITCIDVDTNHRLTDYRMTEVTMRSLSDSEMNAYASTGEGLDKAGAYAIQGLGATLVTGIHGCYFNVVGLSLSLLNEMLKSLGKNIL